MLREGNQRAFVEPMDAVRRDLHCRALLRDATLEDTNEYERLGCPAGLVGLGGKGAFPGVAYNRPRDDMRSTPRTSAV